jgi:gluconate 2-dehydrogenase gamma chain
MSQLTIGIASRRRFIGTSIALVGAPVLRAVGVLVAAPAKSSAVDAASPTHSAAPYRVLNRVEASFTEALVDALCPADRLTPDGVSCGLALAVDRELAVRPAADVRRFRAGISAADNACLSQFRTRLDRLGASDAARFVQSVFAGDPDANGSLASWAHEGVNPVLMQACFTGSIYDTYSNRVFWKIFGHAGQTSVA